MQVDTLRTCTKCGEIEGEVQFKLLKKTNSYGKHYTRAICNSCYNQGKNSMTHAARKAFGKGHTTKVIAQNKPPEGTPCPICKSSMLHGQKNKSMCFDHDHTTHTFRGWICRECNMAIGHLGDTVEGLQAALDYLKNSKLNETIN